MQDVHTQDLLSGERDADIAPALLAWYRREGRALPWRAPPGTLQDPYKVWLSEIMLQQTTVKTVTPRFIDFFRRWPDVDALARAELGEVLAAWAGLGYYARVRNLHACARVISEELDGRFPDTEEGLRALPGIGAYTSAAIAAIAFGRPASPVDGNIERVIARLYAITVPLPEAKPRIKALAEQLTPKTHAGDFAQALMDLGATICTPRRPACGLCPVRPGCQGYKAGLADQLPYKAAKAERPTRRGAAFVAIREDGAVLLRERPPKGLLGGMLETPSTPWVEEPPSRAEESQSEKSQSEKSRAQESRAEKSYAPLTATWRKLPEIVTHTFTHFHLELAVYRANVGQRTKLKGAAEPDRCRWVMQHDLRNAALPTVMRKVLGSALTVQNVEAKKPASRGLRRASRRSA